MNGDILFGVFMGVTLCFIMILIISVKYAYKEGK